MQKRYCYKFPNVKKISDVNGNKRAVALNRYWHEAVKAEKAAEKYAKQFKATEWLSDPNFFGGGVAYLIFGDVIPDSTIWRVGTKVEGGTLCYEPNVQMVQMMAHVKRGLHPSDTWNRVYRKNPMTFEMVKRRYKLEEWAQFGKYVLSGNEEKDWHRIDKMFSGFDFYDFVLIRPSTEIKKDKKGNDKFSLAQRRAVYAQKQRMQLPVVRVEDLYKIMDANLVAKDENGKLIKSQSSPTFFKYWNDLYFASDYPCKGDDLIEISLADYNIAMREAQRRAEKKDK